MYKKNICQQMWASKCLTCVIVVTCIIHFMTRVFRSLVAHTKYSRAGMLQLTLYNSYNNSIINFYDWLWVWINFEGQHTFQMVSSTHALQYTTVQPPLTKKQKPKKCVSLSQSFYLFINIFNYGKLIWRSEHGKCSILMLFIVILIYLYYLGMSFLAITQV